MQTIAPIPVSPLCVYLLCVLVMYVYPNVTPGMVQGAIGSNTLWRNVDIGLRQKQIPIISNCASRFLRDTLDPGVPCRKTLPVY